MKRKRNDPVTPEMRERLLENRSGKMTVAQWLDIVMQPMTALVVLLIPAGFLLLPRAVALFARGGWFIVLVLVAIALSTFLMRAYRYARRPLRYATMDAVANTPPVWMFWRPLILRDEAGRVLRFRQRLAPRPPLARDETYHVYYLMDGDEPVLLSAAPVDHPDADQWRPSEDFAERSRRRTG
ncbi:MAG: hypothetical protein ACOCX3_01850 [Chloroflexota bacterium]